MDTLDFVTIDRFKPLDGSTHKNWNNFVYGPKDKYQSIVAKIYTNSDLDVVIHNSFLHSIQLLEDRKAVRGEDYIISSLWRDGNWHLCAVIDRKFISEEDF